MSKLDICRTHCVYIHNEFKTYSKRVTDKNGAYFLSDGSAFGHPDVYDFNMLFLTHDNSSSIDLGFVTT